MNILNTMFKTNLQSAILERLLSAFFKYDSVQARVDYFMKDEKLEHLFKSNCKEERFTKQIISSGYMDRVIFMHDLLRLNLKDIFSHEEKELPIYILLKGQTLDVGGAELNSGYLAYPINNRAENRVIILKIVNLLFMLQETVTLDETGKKSQLPNTVSEYVTRQKIIKSQGGTYSTVKKEKFLTELEEEAKKMFNISIDKARMDTDLSDYAPSSYEFSKHLVVKRRIHAFDTSGSSGSSGSTLKGYISIGIAPDNSIDI